MRAARWVVIGTALVAAATAFHLLMSPSGGSRSERRSQAAGSGGSGWAADRAADGSRSGGGASTASDGGAGAAGRGASGPPAAGGLPLDEIDAASREAMRSFLRESAQDGK